MKMQAFIDWVYLISVALGIPTALLFVEKCSESSLTISS
jgi:hypothetical protein